MTNESRHYVLKMRMTTDETRVLDKVAGEHGLNRPSLIRMLVAREHRMLFANATIAGIAKKPGP